MYVVEVFLPLADNRGKAFDPRLYQNEKQRLAQIFGGLTAYSRAPAEGFWSDDGHAGQTRDAIVIFEIMAAELDRAWWANYRRELEALFRQDEVVIRVSVVEKL